jgi:hypothetical protein
MFLIDGLQKIFQAQPVLAGDIRARQVRQSQPNTLINLLRKLRVPTSLQQLQQANIEKIMVWDIVVSTRPSRSNSIPEPTNKHHNHMGGSGKNLALIL